MMYRGTLYYPGGEFGICSDIDLFTYSQKYKNWSRNNDPCKKARTDALTKGLSELGFNADVFLGLYDDNKYVAERQAEEQGSPSEVTDQQSPEPPPLDMDNEIRKLIATHGKNPCGAAATELWGENRQPTTLDELTQLTEKLQENKT